MSEDDSIRLYSVQVDNEELCRIDLTKDQYSSQASRDIIRKALAKEFGVPVHYIRLKWTNFIVVYDREAKVNKRVCVKNG